VVYREASAGASEAREGCGARQAPPLLSV
jgi:hypothetical protein